jgi:GntR family transcriptional regulator
MAGALNRQRAAKGAKGTPRLNTATPIYVQLIMHFREQIASGKWRLHGTIPALEELAREFGVTRVTVRQAIGFLEREGLLTSRRGRGTTVIAEPRRDLWQPISDSWAELVASADTIEGEVLELPQPLRLLESSAAPDAVLAPNYHVVRRLLRRAGIPYLVGTSYIDRRIIDEVGIDSLKTRSIYRTIALSKRSTATRGDQTTTVGSADAEIAFFLEIPLGAPIVTVVRRVLDQHNTLIYESEGQFRSDFIQASRRLR